jgi:DNA-binding IclR family transcriptional regulator
MRPPSGQDPEVDGGATVKPTRTLLRGLQVLEALARSPEPLGPTRVADAVDLDKATAGRLLFTLAEAGYVQAADHGTYRLTARLLELAQAAPLAPQLRERARPHLLALRDATGETVHLGIREEARVVYIDKFEGTHPVRLVSAVGQSMPVHTTALGKAALAWMDEGSRERLLADLVLEPRTERSITTGEELRRELRAARARGFAIDDRENEEHATCVGAPILGPGDEVQAMISVSGPSYRVMDAVDELGARCRSTADEISNELTAPGP